MSEPLPIGFYPFWFWNDGLSADEIRWQVSQMAQQGVRRVFVHSRQGLEQPYMSTAFLDLVEVAVEAAEQHGMWVHLYDEYPYPSGVAGGSVVMGNPQYYATWRSSSAARKGFLSVPKRTCCLFTLALSNTRLRSS